jgi:lipoyl(octanoyl) transferase
VHRQDLHWYLRQVEEVIIQAMARIGLPCDRNTGNSGVWTQGVTGDEPRLRKIASIGVHARDWVTWHGFALNVSTDLSFFDLIVPCGISDVTMTSVEKELGPAFPGPERVSGAIVQSLESVFSLTAERRSRAWLESMVENASPLPGGAMSNR